MSLLDALGASAMSFADTWYQNRQNTKNAHEANDFNKWMYQNRYQMQVHDLQAAGLNPMLAYNQAPGSAPSAAVAHAEKTDAPRVFNESRLASAQEGNIAADTQKKLAEKNNIDADTLVKNGMPALIAQQVVQATASAKQAEAMADQIRASIPKIEKEIASLEQKTKLDKSNETLNYGLVTLNRTLVGLRAAETYLTNARVRTETYNADVLRPKAVAAGTHGAEAGHYAEQSFGKILQSLNPFKIIMGGN